MVPYRVHYAGNRYRFNRTKVLFRKYLLLPKERCLIASSAAETHGLKPKSHSQSTIHQSALDLLGRRPRQHRVSLNRANYAVWQEASGPDIYGLTQVASTVKKEILTNIIL